MAGVTALRDAARGALLAGGGRGFVRFAPEGEALLLSDAARRCESDADVKRLVDALMEAGFCVRVRDGLMEITPGDGLLLWLCGAQPERICPDPAGALFETAALADRFLRETRLPLSQSGRRMAIETARLLWRPKEQVLAGMPALRARAAKMLRNGERSGLYEAGRLLAGWLYENDG